METYYNFAKFVRPSEDEPVTLYVKEGTDKNYKLYTLSRLYKVQDNSSECPWYPTFQAIVKSGNYKVYSVLDIC